MVHRVLTVFGALALIFPFVTASHWSRHHQEVAHRARGDVHIHKRDVYSNARFTFYDVGLGACGQQNVASDFIVALNFRQFQYYGTGYPNPICFQSITIQYNGQTAQATIMDECPGCPWGGLDLSRGLFDYFASETLGVLYGSWWLNEGGSTSTSTSSTSWEQPTTTPTSSSTPDYTPTTSTTPVYSPPPATDTTTTTTSISSTTTQSITTPTSATSFNTSLAVPTGGGVTTPNPSNPQNILVINNILIEVGVMLSAAELTGKR